MELAERTIGDSKGRLVILAKNEAGYNCTQVDVLELVDWLKKNRPDLLV